MEAFKRQSRVLHRIFLKQGLTVQFVTHGRRARIFCQIFVQSLDGIVHHGVWPGFGGQNIQLLPLYWDREIQFYSSTGTENYSFTVLQGRRTTIKELCIKYPKYYKSHV